MVKRNTTPVAFETDFKPGRYLAEIQSVEVKNSTKSGHPYLSLRISAVEWGRQTLCWDILMLDGQGAGIATKKLEALGYPPDQEEINEAELVGQRMYVQVSEQEYRGEKQLKVNIKAKDDSYCGWWPETENPGGLVEKPEESMDDILAAGETKPAEDDTPF